MIQIKNLAERLKLMEIREKQFLTTSLSPSARSSSSGMTPKSSPLITIELVDDVDVDSE